MFKFFYIFSLHFYVYIQISFIIMNLSNSYLYLQIGGTPGVIRFLLEEGFLDGDCMTG